MLKLPKGLKKKKKGKKSKRKGEDELFTEEELEKYRREHQQAQQEGEATDKENEEWSKFKDLTTGIDSVLKKTQGDLDRIKSTSFFQRVPAGPKETTPARSERTEPQRPYVEVTAADFPQLAAAAAAAAAADEERSDAGLTDDDSEEDDQDDIFDTSYVEAVERGEVKLAYVPDSPEDVQDDDIFDTSHVDALIHGSDTSKTSKGKKALDIGIAVGVLTGRIDHVSIPTTKRSKRIIPGDLLLESTDCEGGSSIPAAPVIEPVETSILDTDADVPITTPIDLSVSLHTTLLQQQNKGNSKEDLSLHEERSQQQVEEDDEFTLLAAESLAETSVEVIKLEDKEIKLEPVLQESWSAFEADKSESVFAECIVEDQIDVIDPYLDQDDPFDTSFADAVVPTSQPQQVKREAVILEDDDDFDPRAEEIQKRLNNRRKSSVRIHLTDPSGLRESITSDELIDREEESANCRDLLGGSTTDLTQLGDSPLNPVDINNTEIDPFDTTIVDKIVAPGKVELKLLEQELIGAAPAPVPVYRVDSDPDFDPRAEEALTRKAERRASRPENLVVSKSVVFNVEGDHSIDLDDKHKPPKPVTPYYTREVSISEDLQEECEAADIVPALTRTRSDEDIPARTAAAPRRHSECPRPQHAAPPPPLKVLTPRAPLPSAETDPFDTTFAGDIAPSRTELRLLAKEFSCEEAPATVLAPGEIPDLLDPSDDIFQVKALTPEPSDANRVPEEDYDPFDTSFASDLNPGRTELKLLESEFLG